jgi:organic radical activating enzyme
MDSDITQYNTPVTEPCNPPSKTWCAQPWQHAHLDTTQTRKLCCISGSTNARQTPIEKFWNSRYMRNVRKKMLSGESITECKACYDVENAGGTSLRNDVNSQISTVELTELLSGTSNDGYYHGTPTFYDYRTNHCNLQCRSCGPYFSSQHVKLTNQMAGKKIIASDKSTSYEDRCVAEIKKGIDERKVKKLYWAGGEPMMSPIHWNIMEYLEEKLHNPDYCQYVKGIKQIYHTNLTKVIRNNKSIPDQLAQFQTTVICSLDGSHETLVYTRDGAIWSEISKNLDHYTSVLTGTDQVRIATVTSAPVIFDIERYLNYYSKYNLYMHPHYMLGDIRTPSKTGFLNIKQYPPNLFHPAIEKAKLLIKEFDIKGAKRWQAVLTRYQKEYDQECEVLQHRSYLAAVKAHQLYRDHFNVTNRSLIDLYSIVNSEARDWILSLDVLVTEQEQEKYIKTLGINYTRD